MHQERLKIRHASLLLFGLFGDGNVYIKLKIEQISTTGDFPPPPHFEKHPCHLHGSPPGSKYK